MAGTSPASDSAQSASSDAELFSVDNMQLHTLPDKRVLCYRVYGATGPSTAPPGTWAVYYHGTPSCCLEGAAFDEAARSLGISLICTDRPGIGGSSSSRHQSLASVVADTASLLDAMGVAKVYLVGTSGGAPYAAAFAAQHPERSLGMALTAALAPTDRRHKELLKAMAGADRFMFTMARYPVGGLRLMHGVMRYMANRHPQALLEHAPQGMAKVDGELMRNDPRVKANFGACLQHAYKQGAVPMARDVKVLAGRWNVDMSGVSCPTAIWQGADDLSVPVQHAHWWASTISGSELHIMESHGHVTLPLKMSHEILASLRVPEVAKAPLAEKEAPLAEEETLGDGVRGGDAVVEPETTSSA